MKITIYELLGMIKDGKAPKKIKYENREYYLYDNKSYLSTDKTRFFERIYFSDLNIEVEILEEKEIPKKLGTYTITDETISGMRKSLNTMINIDIIGTINEIIDYLKSQGE